MTFLTRRTEREDATKKTQKLSIVPWDQLVRDIPVGDHLFSQSPCDLPSLVSWRTIERPTDHHHVMNCQRFQSLIAPAVDCRLSDEEMEFFVDHAARCSSCRREYDMHRAVKAAVQRHVHVVRAPQSVTEGIRARIAAEGQRTYAAATVAPRVRLSRIAAPAAAVVLLCVLLLLLVRVPGAPASGGHDMIPRLLSDFHALAEGRAAAALPEDIAGFFSGKTEFPVVIPAVREFQLVGARVSDHDGAHTAQLIYRHDARLLYVSQACWTTVVKGEQIDLPVHVKRELLRSGWFSNIGPDGEGLVLWTKGNTLCAAVARMAPTDLRARLVTELEAPAGIPH